jgi:3-isopropylmalate/(R)-2-methylmalate dehydratase small subunit
MSPNVAKAWHQSPVFVGSLAPLGRDHVDTDQIIPARFLKGTEKTGLGRALFYDWRTRPGDGQTPDPSFVLNQPVYQGASVLVAGENFGCGSSREHAPWALVDAGFRAVVAVSFADIFQNNALKNGLLPLALPADVVAMLLETARQQPGTSVTVDLAAQTLTLPNGQAVSFHIDAFRKQCLLQGVDEIGYSLQFLPAIEAYEARLTAEG